MRILRSMGCSGAMAWCAAVALVLAPAGPAQAQGNQWTSNGPPNAAVRAVAIDPQTVGTVYAGTTGLGMFKSTTGGASWISTNLGIASPLIGAVAIDPQTTEILYAGTNGAGMFKSFNGGLTWAPINTGLTNFLINALAVDPQVTTTVYAATNGGGVFQTLNGGATWLPVNAGLVNGLVTALAIDPQTPATVYAGTTGGGVFKTTNAGTSWSPVNTGLVNAVVTALAINPQNTAIVYAGTTGGGVFVSTNGAASWAPASNGLGNTAVTALAVDGQIPTTLYAATNGGGVFQSTDGASTWATFSNNTGLANLVVNALAITPSSICLHAATTSAVFDFAAQIQTCTSTPSPLSTAVLPSSRAVQSGTTATAFATVLNAGATMASACSVAPLTSVPATFLFQTTNPLTNQPTGSANALFTVPAGGQQTLLVAFTALAAFSPVEILLNFTCANTVPAALIGGVNTLLLSAGVSPLPDIVALAATTTGNGIVDIPSTNGTGAFSVATVNVGANGFITVSADTAGAAMPLTVSLCQTNPNTAMCLSPPTPTVSLNILAGQSPTFGVFATASGPVPLLPGVNRVFVRFTDTTGVIRGSTSVAVQTQ